MSRWVTWAKSRSRRRRSVRRRILRIDELESRRLLCGTLLGGALERSFQDDEFESEDGFEADEGDDLPLAATLGRAAVVDSHDAEGEDDGWEDETESWTYTIPAARRSNNPAPVGSVIAVPAGNAFSFFSVVVLDVSGTEDEDAPVENVTPATNVPNQANGVDETIAASPTRRTEDESNEAESSASETDVQTDRETIRPSDGDQPAASPSPGQTELTDPAAATPSPMEEKTVANLDRGVPVNPAAPSNRIPQDDGRLASDAEEQRSLAPSRTTGDGSSETVEMPSRSLDGPQRHASSAAASPSRHTRRHVETQPGYDYGERGWLFAALVPGSYGTSNWRLREALSHDLAALETALQDLLADTREMGGNMADWLLSPDVIHWTLAATIALIAAEIVRQKAQRSRSVEQPPPCDGMDGSLRLFPELLGLPPGTSL
jgi:hypothetical protein